MKFIETVKVTNGNIFNLKEHNRRFNKTRKHFFNLDFLDINSLIDKKDDKRVRITYNSEIINIEYFPLVKREFKSFKIVECNEIEYKFKYLNREKLNSLKDKSFDEIIIIKNGLVTDTTISNLAFFDGKKWFTPKTPLLKGTMREKLLKDKKIFEADIKNPFEYHKFAMINAIIEFQEFDIIQIKKD